MEPLMVVFSILVGIAYAGAFAIAVDKVNEIREKYKHLLK